MLTNGQLEKMKHTIGFRDSLLPRKQFLAYRNCFQTEKEDKDWKELLLLGFAKQRDPFSAPLEGLGKECYALTEPGIHYLEETLNCSILTLSVC